MNKWRMEGRSLKWADRGGHAKDDLGNIHWSIHPNGRNDEYRQKQRRLQQRSR